MIPQNYPEWRYCIEFKCQIKLTKDYINQRIQELTNYTSPETTEFINKYGNDYHTQVISWFKQAAGQTN